MARRYGDWPHSLLMTEGQVASYPLLALRLSSLVEEVGHDNDLDDKEAELRFRAELAGAKLK